MLLELALAFPIFADRAAQRLFAQVTCGSPPPAGRLLLPGGQEEAETEQFRTVFRRDIRHTIDGSIVADSALTGMMAAMSRPIWDAPQTFGLGRHITRYITARRSLP